MTRGLKNYLEYFNDHFHFWLNNLALPHATHSHPIASLFQSEVCSTYLLTVHPRY